MRTEDMMVEEHVRTSKFKDLFDLVVATNHLTNIHAPSSLSFLLNCRLQNTMSDREAFSSAVDDELSLPKATVSKMIAGKSHKLLSSSIKVVTACRAPPQRCNLRQGDPRLGH